MKKNIIIISAIALFFSFETVQAQVHYQNTTTNNTNSSAIGYGTVASGEKSFASGLTSTASGVGSTTLGIDNLASGHYSMTLGSNLKAGNGHSIVIGSGYANSFKLENNRTYSLMVGFLSQYPTLFVGTSPSYNKTGRIGIGNVTSPTYKLHIKADEGEAASVFITPNSWKNGEQASLLLGSNLNGITASYAMGLTFNSQQDYYFPDGNVSIGRSTNPPEAALDVSGTVKMNGFQLSGHEIIQPGWVLVANNINGTATWQDPSGFMQGLWSENANQDIYRMSSVGIGTNTPQEKLDVEGNITLADAIIGKESKSLWNDPDYLTIKGSESDRAAKIMIPKGFSEENNALKIINPGNEGGIQFSNEGIINFNIRKDDVVIGRPDHEMEVKVNGKIWSYEVEVQIHDWWDEVFSNGYSLMPLNELESYIAINSHLPEIPTEKEVMENGIELGEMNALLLKKIEELTLYVIELKKELDEVKQQETQTK